MAAFVDIQCFKSGKDLVVKELSIATTTSNGVKTWFFKPPYSDDERRDADIQQDRWLRDNFHGLRWCDGDRAYGDLQFILHGNLNACYFIFAKGREKCDMLQRVLKYRVVLNMEILGCPSLRKLKCKGSRNVCSIEIHRKTGFECASRNSVNLLDWFLTNGGEKLTSSSFHRDSFIGVSHKFAVKTKVLAEAGFFYSGDRDVAVCCVCGVALGCWDPWDRPDKEHYRWNPYCPLVRVPVEFGLPHIKHHEIKWNSHYEKSCDRQNEQQSACSSSRKS